MGAIWECFCTPLIRYKKTFAISITNKRYCNEYNPIYRHITDRPNHRIKKFFDTRIKGATFRPIPTHPTNGIPHTFRSL